MRFLVLFFIMSNTALSAKLDGRLSISLKDGSKQDSCSHAAVFLESDSLEKSLEKKKFTMKLADRNFSPNILTIPVGSEVSFPNDDVILHNVFSLSKTKKFDLGLYKKGETKSSVFEKPGLVKVFCNIHPEMVGYILILDHSYYGEVKEDCSYSIETPKDGSYKISAWYAFGKGVSQDIVVKNGKISEGSLDLSVKRTKKGNPSHKNKHGKRYKKAY